MTDTKKTDRDFGGAFPKLEDQNAADATGLWFAAAVLCAFLAAGVIVYRTAVSEDEISSPRPTVAQANTGVLPHQVWPR